jgi:hypothetical protein
MPKFQELKTDPGCFELSLAGKKPWEVRFNDRGYEEGDVLRLRETRYTGREMKGREASGTTATFKNAEGEKGVAMWSEPPKPLEYTGRELIGVVQNVFSGPEYGLKVGWVILTVQLVMKADFNALERAKEGQG